MAMAALSPVPSGCLLRSPSRNSPAILSLPSNSSGGGISTPALFSKNSGRRKKTGPSSSVASGFFRKSQAWRQVNYSYSGVGTDFSSAPIDVLADVRTEKIVILGGSGFVGCAIAKEAVKRDIEVVSLSRSGRPSYPQAWLDKVIWISGDVFSTDWDVVLHGATAVVSTLGGVGTNEQMEKLNGDANIISVDAASRAGIKKFIYISVHDYNLPDFALNLGYFTGKKRAEQEVLNTYPKFGTILRPGFIYGSRRVNGIDIPLDLIGQPLEGLLAQTQIYTRPFAKLPAADLLFASPISVKDVALAALKAIKDDTVSGILNIEQIKNAAASLVAV